MSLSDIWGCALSHLNKNFLFNIILLQILVYLLLYFLLLLLFSISLLTPDEDYVSKALVFLIVLCVVV